MLIVAWLQVTSVTEAFKSALQPIGYLHKSGRQASVLLCALVVSLLFGSVITVVECLIAPLLLILPGIVELLWEASSNRRIPLPDSFAILIVEAF